MEFIGAAIDENELECPDLLRRALSRASGQAWASFHGRPGVGRSTAARLGAHLANRATEFGRHTGFAAMRDVADDLHIYVPCVNQQETLSENIWNACGRFICQELALCAERQTVTDWVDGLSRDIEHDLPMLRHTILWGLIRSGCDTSKIWSGKADAFIDWVVIALENRDWDRTQDVLRRLPLTHFERPPKQPEKLATLCNQLLKLLGAQRLHFWIDLPSERATDQVFKDLEQLRVCVIGARTYTYCKVFTRTIDFHTNLYRFSRSFLIDCEARNCVFDISDFWKPPANDSHLLRIASSACQRTLGSASVDLDLSSLDVLCKCLLTKGFLETVFKADHGLPRSPGCFYVLGSFVARHERYLNMPDTSDAQFWISFFRDFYFEHIRLEVMVIGDAVGERSVKLWIGAYESEELHEQSAIAFFLLNAFDYQRAFGADMPPTWVSEKKAKHDLTNKLEPFQNVKALIGQKRDLYVVNMHQRNGAWPMIRENLAKMPNIPTEQNTVYQLKRFIT
jgi:hypothetical protein